MYKSEIRDSTIAELSEKVSRLNYGRYLPKISIKKLRGFSDQTITFDFPVTAIIGPNGGGKTTILGAAACAYKSIQPRRFFAKSGNFDESMQDWSVEYEIVDRTINARDTFRRTSTFRNLRWNRDAPARDVLLFGVSRTVPPNEKIEYRACTANTFRVQDDQISPLSPSVCTAVSKILDKSINGFKSIQVTRDGRVCLLTGVTGRGISYSEFHFGAGESSIIRMIQAIDAAPEQTLVLIEEIENGLHPLATIKIVEYLINAAKEKKIQVIFTTHSNEALLPLPSNAIWVAKQDSAFQGKLDVSSLRALTGQISKGGAIFVEDAFAKIWLEAIIRQFDANLLDQVEIHAVQGDGNAASINRSNNLNPARKHKSICFVDGDSRQQPSHADRVFKLPGEMPENHVFDGVMESWPQVGGRLTVALYAAFDATEIIREKIDSVARSNTDRHLIFDQIGERCGFIPGETVKLAYCNIWAQINERETQVIGKIIQDLLDRDGNIAA